MIMDAELATKITEIEQRGKSNTHQIEEIKKKQDNLDSLVTSVASMATEQENIKADVTEIKSDVKSLKDIPAKHWEDFVAKLLWALVAAALGFTMAKLGIQ